MNEQTLFMEALDRIDPAERAAFLEQACNGDRTLRKRVERLLAEYAKAEGFLETPLPVSECTIDEPLVEQAGVVIGPYKLLELIGEGGMGDVWLAEQTHPIQRRVAVKVVRAGLDSKPVLARFEAERTALALMDHPNIAKALDAGTTPLGRPYFVMELIKGTPITKFCDEKRFDLHERLALFTDVCRAVQHAHQKGIIHRDIKPSNVLVAPYDGTPVVKVIDFGVARAIGQRLTDATLFTGFGAVVGTPAYMSPEQAEVNNKDIDTRSDVYSLGVLLYELLTGTTPLTRHRVKETPFLELLRVIRDEEPPKPSTRLSATLELPSIATTRRTEPAKLKKVVSGDLDWIVMKALDKDRNRRYESANSFAMDVQRYLNDEPVAACPPSMSYRLRKLIRRNRGSAAAAAVVAMGLLLGTLGLSIGLVWALRAQRDATRAAEAESAERQRAEKAYIEEAEQRRRARKAVDEMYTQVAQKWLAKQPRMQKVQREFLEKALEHYGEFTKDQNADPAMRLETASAYRRLGRIYQSLGQTAKAEEAYRQALSIVDKLTADFPGERSYREESAENHHGLGFLQMYSNRAKDAEESFQTAVRLYAQLIAYFGPNAALRRDLASSRHNLGIVLSGVMGGTARVEQALKEFGQSVDMHKELTAEFPNDALYQSNLGAVLSDWGTVLLSNGQPAKAKPLLKEAIEHQRAALKLEPRTPIYRQFLSNHLASWADIVQSEGNHAEAVRSAREALTLQELLAAEFPDIPHYRHATAEYALHLGTKVKADNAKEAEALFRQAVTLLEGLSDTFADMPVRRNLLTECHLEIATLMEESGRHAEASVQLRSALKWQPKNASILDALGRNLSIQQHLFAEAEPVWRECLKIREETEPDAWTTFDTKTMLGAALMGQEKCDEAERLLLAGYEGMKQRESKIKPEERIHLLQAIDLLVQLYDGWDKPAKAAQWRKILAEQRARNKKT